MSNKKAFYPFQHLTSTVSAHINKQLTHHFHDTQNTYANIEITTIMNSNTLSNKIVILDYENHYFDNQTKRLHPNYIAFSYVTSGTLSYLYEETAHVLEEKNGLLWDSHIEFQSTIQQMALTLIFPKRMFQQLISQLQVFINQPIPMYTDDALIVVQYFKFLFDNQNMLKKNTESLLLQTFIELLTIYTHSLNASPISSHRRELIENIKKFIEENIKNPSLTPSKIAEHFAVSTRYIHQLFKTEGITVASFILDMRLERCQRDIMLLYPKKKVIDIAFKWGFNDAAHFSKVFKKKYGVSPSKYYAQRDSLH